MVKIEVKKLRTDARIPEYAHLGDAGLDIFSVEDFVLPPRHRRLVSTGISMALPSGYVALVWDKSGIAFRGIKTMGGVIDADYRGEYKILLVNLSGKDYVVERGQKIAQVLIQKVEQGELEVVDVLSKTVRAEGGFGSTGLH